MQIKKLETLAFNQGHRILATKVYDSPEQSYNQAFLEWLKYTKKLNTNTCALVLQQFNYLKTNIFFFNPKWNLSWKVSPVEYEVYGLFEGGIWQCQCSLLL